MIKRVTNSLHSQSLLEMRATGFNFIRKPPEEKIKNNKELGPGHYNPTNSLTFKKCLNYTFKKYKPDCTF